MLNNVCLMGRLTADPELKHTPNNVPVVNFCIAVDRSFAKAGSDRITDFINIVAWRNTAEFVAKYFGKGSLIALEGSIQTRKYEDREGNSRTAFEVMANNVHFAESKKRQADPEMNPEPEQNKENVSDFVDAIADDFTEMGLDGDLPF